MKGGTVFVQGHSRLCLYTCSILPTGRGGTNAVGMSPPPRALNSNVITAYGTAVEIPAIAISHPQPPPLHTHTHTSQDVFGEASSSLPRQCRQLCQDPPEVELGGFRHELQYSSRTGGPAPEGAPGREGQPCSALNLVYYCCIYRTNAKLEANKKKCIVRAGKPTHGEQQSHSRPEAPPAKATPTE